MILILGIGNDMRGDDAFGPLVIKELEGKTSAELWSGDTPENFIGSIKEPVETLIILDTAHLEKEPGTVELLDTERISKTTTSTHKLPLSLIIDQLKTEKIYFIVAQPKSTEFGTEPSKEIKKAVDKAVSMVKKIINA